MAPNNGTHSSVVVGVLDRDVTGMHVVDIRRRLAVLCSSNENVCAVRTNLEVNHLHHPLPALRPKRAILRYSNDVNVVIPRAQQSGSIRSIPCRSQAIGLEIGVCIRYPYIPGYRGYLGDDDRQKSPVMELDPRVGSIAARPLYFSAITAWAWATWQATDTKLGLLNLPDISEKPSCPPMYVI